MTIPTDDVFFSKTEKGKPDVEFLKDHFYREGRIKERHALYIIDKATQLLRAEPNVLTIDRDAPVMVCGNIHAQYYDLMKLFELYGHPSNTHYLFLGGYINRGHFSIECLLYLWTLKTWYPNTFFLLRGSHECRLLSEHYTFEIECKHKYSERVYEACLESFDTLPLVAIIAKRYFCVHGGISPDLHTIDDIRKLNRFCEPPNSGLMCDISLSDPIEDFDEGYTTENFVHNSLRGVSYFYTYKAVCDFLERNRLVSIIRAHQGFKKGYRTYRKRYGNPSVITVFSAPNYGGRKNRAAVLSCHGKECIVQQFNWSPHPHRLPIFLDAFSWSLPFICEKVMDMLAVVLYIYLLELSESIENSTLSVARLDRDKVELLEMLQNKILAVRCISYMFSVFRVGSEHVSELKTFLRSSRLRDGVVSLRAEDIKKAIKSLNEARILDEDNTGKRLPPIKRQLTSTFLPLPNAKDSAGERVASAGAAAGATPMTPIIKTMERGELVAKELNTDVQDREAGVRSRKAADEPSDTSHCQTEPRTSRATAGIQEIEKQLQEKERGLQIWEAEVQDVEKRLRVKESDLRIREADVQDVEKVLRVMERDLQIREADVEKVLRVKVRGLQSRESEVQKMLQAVNERREAMDLQEDNLRQQLAAMKQWEENLRLKEAALTQQMTTARQPNGAARESDLFSISSFSTIRNSPRIHTNVDLKSHAALKDDSEYYNNE